MNFEYSDTTKRLLEQLFNFMDSYVYPLEKEVGLLTQKDPNAVPDFLAPLKQKAKAAGMLTVPFVEPNPAICSLPCRPGQVQ